MVTEKQKNIVISVAPPNNTPHFLIHIHSRRECVFLNHVMVTPHV